MRKGRLQPTDVGELSQTTKKSRLEIPCNMRRCNGDRRGDKEPQAAPQHQIETKTEVPETPNKYLDNSIWSGEDSIFSDIILSQENVETKEKSESTQNYWNYLADDSFDIDDINEKVLLDEIRKDESEKFADCNIQCTQRFLDDVKCNTSNDTHVSPNKTLALNNNVFEQSMLFCGSQYETRENIRNRSILSRSELLNNELHDLSELNWETQVIFHAEEVPNFNTKGPFYDLPKKVEELIYANKGITSLYEWQKECLQLPAIQRRKNLLYALPTSGGKTLVAEILMLREIICRGKNVMFILPYVSIVQEKVSAMSPFALDLDFLVEEYTAGKGRCPPPKRQKRKSIYIASIEKGAVLFDSLIEAQRANEIGLVVIDELHLIGEKGRGSILETLLTKVMYLKAGIQIVGMSATIGNLPELSEFLDADIYTRGFRPVELKEFIKCGSDILQINPSKTTIEEKFSPARTVNFKYSSAVQKADPDHLAGLVSEVIPTDSCLIFCSTRKNCENVAQLLTKILPKEKHLEHRRKERADLLDALDKICGTVSPVLQQTVPYGIAYHHSGLTTDERKMLEYAYRNGIICVICCTSTLAAGVNLPAKRVIIRAPYVGQNFMNLSQYKQMVGRAGRAGMGEAGESILICSSKDNFQVAQMLSSPMNKVISSMDWEDAIGLQTLILSAIGLGMANCRRDLLTLANQTLLAVQCEELGVAIEASVKRIVKEMFHHKVLKIADDRCNSSSFWTTQDVENITDTSQRRTSKPVLTQSTKIELTTIGKAAFKAGIDYKRAQSIYDELKSAQKMLVLSNYSHLLYLVVSFNSTGSGDELIAADSAILFREFTTNLDEGTQGLARVLGITEAHAVRVAKRMSTKGQVELQLNRFYKVLIMRDVMQLMPLHLVAAKYNTDRGMIQTLSNQSIAAASAITRMCEQVDEFWCFKPLFERISNKLDRCGTVELEPLLELPSVKINRAKQLYAAGFTSIDLIARSKPHILGKCIEHLSFKTAKEIICAAKMILMKKLEILQEETDAIMHCLQSNEDN